MKCARPLALILLLLSLCLFIPATTWAGTEAIPAEILSDTAIDTLDRLVFRYETVHFNLDSSVLLERDKRALDRKVRWLRAHPEAAVLVEGHCDAHGTSEYNMSLGERRAAAARDYLVEQGIAPDRIQLVSWGKERPYVTGSGEPACTRNRRAEFIPQ